MRTFAALLTVCALSGLARGASPTPPVLRLPEGVRPTRYTAELTVDPTRTELSGVLDIELSVTRPLEVLWLNATELTVERAQIDGAPATVIPGGKDFIGVIPSRTLAPGKARVHLEYHGQLSSKDSSGASRQQEGEDWYVFTHFEPIDARRVFPCFDEPGYKVPWKLALRVRQRDLAFANTSPIEERALPDGYKRIAFGETKPLPSYLVAWAVGPFEIVDGGKTQRSSTPIRIITPKGQADRARWAAASSRESLDHLETYFGSSYPYGKLDCIAVPLFGGAMENPGLVTFASSLILQKPAEETIERKREYANVATHEFAHQWFGDLVTMAWWDDLWLNEAFASWMTPKIIERWQPSWGAAEGRIGTRSRAMSSDSLVSARKIRQPITSNDDMKNAFDAITYSKGATVIGMFERFVGADAFQRGVRRYLAQHAHGNATARDFLAAISLETGHDIAPAFSTFLDQPGVPIVAFELACDGAPRLKLSQQRFLPAGSTGHRDDQLWQIPICVRWDGASACTVLANKQAELALTGTKTCPAWVLPNDGGSGYFRAQLAPALSDALAGAGLAALSVPEKLATISDLDALVYAGKLELGVILKLARSLATDTNRWVLASLANAVGFLREEELLDGPSSKRYPPYLRQLFGVRARQLGWQARASDDEDARLLRARLVPLIADAGEDGPLAKQSAELATAWLADHAHLDADIVDAVLATAAAHGNAALHARWLKAAREEQDRSVRRRLLRALASFRDPKLVEHNLAVMLTDDFDVRESIALLWGAAREPRTRGQAWRWLQEHFDALVAKLPRDQGAFLPFVPVSQCDEALVPAVSAFFAERAKRFEGGPRQLAQALEQMHLCATYRTAQAPVVRRYFVDGR